MRIRPRNLLLVILFAVVVLCCGAKTHIQTSTRIVLDPSTFPKISRPLLQETADQVAQVVDQLIPGNFPTSDSMTILCFVAPESWSERPRALIGRTWKVEPAAARNYRMRISVTPNVLPGAWQRFAFQVAHELAHLKMDGRVDNNILETFAVAVSLEVLHRLGYDGFRESNEKYYTQTIPSEVMTALHTGDWNAVGMYLRYAWLREHTEVWDQSTHFVGAIAIRQLGGFPWERLLSIGAYAECGTHMIKDRAQYCPLSPAALAQFRDAFRIALGQDSMQSLIIRITRGRPETPAGSFIFREKGRWLSLRYLRKIDSNIPDGFVPLD